MAWSVVGGLILSVGAFGPAAVAVPQPDPDVIVSCDVEGADLRGVEVCYLDATLTRSGTDLIVDQGFQLFYEDQSILFGEGAAGFVLSVGMEMEAPQEEDEGEEDPPELILVDPANLDGDEPEQPLFSPYESPNAGDVLSTTVLYPVVDRDPSGETEGLRGTDVADAVFAVTTAADFSYTKTVETEGNKSWVAFEIDKTYIVNWFREECDFGEIDEESGFSPPTPECQVENGFGAEGSDPGIVSESEVPNYIAFYTPESFGLCEECGDTESFVNDRTDSGYLNYVGRGLSWWSEDNSFEFQLIGPRYAAGDTLNTGLLQAFLPEGYMKEIYGENFDPRQPSLSAQRFDVTDDGLLVDDLSTAIVPSERNGGLLIELASYSFSAPVFSFAAVEPDTAPAPALAREKKGKPVEVVAVVQPPTLAATGPLSGWALMVGMAAVIAGVGALLMTPGANDRRRRLYTT